MKKYIVSGFSFAMGIAIVSLGLGVFYMPLQYAQNVFGAYNNPTNPPATSSNDQSSTSSSISTGTTSGTNDNSSFALSAKDISGVYRWINPSTDAENPELNLKANSNNTIIIQNPTNAKHELIIDSQGKELATSGDIEPGSSGQLSFRPNSTGTFEYHCEYHPETMKGIISVPP